MNNPSTNIFPILWSMLCAILLNLVSGSGWWWLLWPDFILLILAYWALAAPNVGFRWAVILGLVQDTMLSSVYGTHVLIYALVMYFCVLRHRQFRQYKRWQQAGLIGALMFVSLLLKWALAYLLHGGGAFEPLLLGSVLVAMLLWPLVFGVLRRLRRRYGVA